MDLVLFVHRKGNDVLQRSLLGTLFITILTESSQRFLRNQRGLRLHDR